MRSRSLFGLGMGLAIMAIVGFTRCHGPAPASASPVEAAFCAHVADLSSLLVETKTGSAAQGGARLETLAGEFRQDAASMSATGNPKADQAAGLADDLTQWRQAVLAHDAVGEDVAVNRALSELGAAADC